MRELSKVNQEGRSRKPMKYLEEARHQMTCCRIGVQEADVCKKNGPIHASQEPYDVGVDTPPLSPDLDTPQRYDIARNYVLPNPC